LQGAPFGRLVVGGSPQRLRFRLKLVQTNEERKKKENENNMICFHKT
jgi:hypothetical protein